MRTGVERVRGGADIPMSDQGRLQAHHLGSRIAAKGGIHSIVSGPLERTRQTAAIIHQHNPKAKILGIDDGFGPQQSGELEGEPVEMAKDILDHAIRNPDLPLPGISSYTGLPGESLNIFKDRLRSTILHHFATMKKGEKRLGSTHYRNIRTTKAAKPNGAQWKINPEELIQKDHTDPASLFWMPDPDHIKKVDLDSNEKLEPGLLLARHGATAFSGSGKGTPNSVLSRLGKHHKDA